MPLPLRNIGNAKVNPIGFGSMGLCIPVYGKLDSDEERFKVLDEAYASGCNHWDLADVYGDSEELIGKWFKRTGKRDEIFLATKFGFTWEGGRGDPAYCRQQCENSLKLLGVDHIDLYYLHRPDKNVPIEITVGAMAELVKEGKVKYIGLSECCAEDVRRAHAVHPITAIQVEYSPLVLDIEGPELNLLKTARELGITVVGYSPLARGIITGQVRSPDDFEPDDFRRSIPRYSKENFPKINGFVDKLSEIGRKHKANASQVTMAWILTQGDDFVVIPGTRKIKYLRENLASAEISLTQEEIATIRQYAEDIDLEGDRFGPLKHMAYAPTPPLPK